jgi:TolB protein
MTDWITKSISARRTGIAAVALATATLATVAACIIGATDVANAASTQRQQELGAAARIAVDQAAVALTPGQSLLAAGQQGTGSQIPWRLVGPGWTLVEFTAGNYKVARPVTLYLLDPSGGMYRIYRWPAGVRPWRLVDWSADKKRALVQQVGGKRTTMHQIALATGTVTTFTLPSAASDVLGYTRPVGTNILVAEGGIVRYSLAGALKARLISGSSHYAALSAANGLSELVSGSAGVDLVSNSGGLVRQLPVPGTDAATGGCTPVRWWRSSVALVDCMPRTAVGPRLWLVPLSGAKPTALTPPRNGQGPDLGDLGAWRFPSGLYVQALGACGTRFIGKQAAGGTVTVVHVPGSAGNNVVVTTKGDQMMVREIPGCSQGSSLVWLNPATSAVHAASRAPVGGDGVISVIAFQ